jgi:hypothetical protein
MKKSRQGRYIYIGRKYDGKQSESRKDNMWNYHTLFIAIFLKL